LLTLGIQTKIRIHYSASTLAVHQEIVTHRASSFGDNFFFNQALLTDGMAAAVGAMDGLLGKNLGGLDRSGMHDHGDCSGYLIKEDFSKIGLNRSNCSVKKQ
jgi:hypothetical protein